MLIPETNLHEWKVLHPGWWEVCGGGSMLVQSFLETDLPPTHPAVTVLSLT